MNHGKAIIFCAPSGAGKTTIVKHLIKTIHELKFSVSATTRAPRTDIEENGKDYYFLSIDDFKEKIKKKELLEWEEVYHDIFYGTLKSEVESIWNNGHHVIFDLDVVGGLNLKKVFGDRALAVFVNAESVDILRERLMKRNTESEQRVEMRISKAQKEMSFADKFDYQLINRDLGVALKEAEDLVQRFIL